MNIKCGHCWSYHPSIGDVRDCWKLLREHQESCPLCSDPLADVRRRQRCAANYKTGASPQSETSEPDEVDSEWAWDPDDGALEHGALEIAGLLDRPYSDTADSLEEAVSEFWDMYYGDDYHFET